MVIYIYIYNHYTHIYDSVKDLGRNFFSKIVLKIQYFDGHVNSCFRFDFGWQYVQQWGLYSRLYYRQYY